MGRGTLLLLRTHHFALLSNSLERHPPHLRTSQGQTPILWWTYFFNIFFSNIFGKNVVHFRQKCDTFFEKIDVFRRICNSAVVRRAFVMPLSFTFRYGLCILLSWIEHDKLVFQIVENAVDVLALLLNVETFHLDCLQLNVDGFLLLLQEFTLLCQLSLCQQVDGSCAIVRCSFQT